MRTPLGSSGLRVSYGIMFIFTVIPHFSSTSVASLPPMPKVVTSTSIKWFSVPPLTAIRQPTAAMIAKACEKLIALSKGENAFGSYPLPFDLVIRESTGSPV